ncbi:MAG: YfiR/HmsC family protein, partial [Endozoicomonas sp.]
MGNKIHSFSPKEQLSTALMCLFLSLFCTQVSGASPTKEDKVKAAIVFKLTKFVSWPGRTKALTMCIVGSGSINQELQKINYKFSLGRRISITHKQPTARL